MSAQGGKLIAEKIQQIMALLKNDVWTRSELEDFKVIFQRLLHATNNAMKNPVAIKDHHITCGLCSLPILEKPIPGSELQCPHCDAWQWHSVDEQGNLVTHVGRANQH